MLIRNVGRILMAAIVATSLAAPAAAQVVDVPEEIVVTARKREETLFDIPVSVTALSDKTLFDANLEGLIDISKLSPGFYF